MQNFQNLAQLSSMGTQPLLSGMLDFSLLNNTFGQQGLSGLGGSGGGSRGGTGSSFSNHPMALPSSAAAASQRSYPPTGGMGSRTSPTFNEGRHNGAHQQQQQQQSHQHSMVDQLSRTTSNNTTGSGPTPPFMNQLTSSSMSGVSADLLSQHQHQQLQHQQQQQGQHRVPQGMPPSRAETARRLAITALPPFEEAQTPHWMVRTYIPFSIEEDPNWLSSFQCYIRAEILELFRVNDEGIRIRNAAKSLSMNQVGIRCRFCAHLQVSDHLFCPRALTTAQWLESSPLLLASLTPVLLFMTSQHGTRANRASCFPSKIDKIYQSFTMMLREHFAACEEIPEREKQRFTELQNMNAQGASNAKGYWEHAARKKGLVDLSEKNGRSGIHIFDATVSNAAMIPPFGSSPRFSEPSTPVKLVYSSDQGTVSDFLYALMDQTYRVHLAPSERTGNRKTLDPGMPGFGCRYCYEAGRMGLCRLFPARRRTIHSKIPDLYDHMKRCNLCPENVKQNLINLHNENEAESSHNQDTATRGQEREFFERIWTRLGHYDDVE